MDIKTFRAKTMRDALELVRRELGPAAAVLHTREVNSGPLAGCCLGGKYEVAASAAVNVPSRLPESGDWESGTGGWATSSPLHPDTRSHPAPSAAGPFGGRLSQPVSR